MNIQYYLIHNLDENRKQHMINSFERVNIDNNKVKWILYPNKNDITNEFILSNVIQGLSFTCKEPIYAQYSLRKGQIACTYKHYLCLKDIIENNYEYGVIIEDNNILIDDVPKMINIYIEQLNKLYPDWDVIFDFDYDNTRYIESPLIEGQYVYPKTNEITKQCHGGTKCATFYLLNYKCAKKLYDNYIPFNNAPDWWMNDLFRKLDIKSFWAEPCNVKKWPHISTA